MYCISLLWLLMNKMVWWLLCKKLKTDTGIGKCSPPIEDNLSIPEGLLCRGSGEVGSAPAGLALYS